MIVYDLAIKNKAQPSTFRAEVGGEGAYIRTIPQAC